MQGCAGPGWPIKQGLNRITHGVANSMLLPHVMEFNAVASAERFAHIAQALGEPVEHLSPPQAAAAGARACLRLSRDVGIPQHLCDVGVTREQIPALVEGALRVTRLLSQNPRPMRPEDVAEIFERAL